METLLATIAGLSSLQKVLWVAACLSFFTLLELVIPFSRKAYSRGNHFRVNGLLLLTTFIVNGIFAAILVAIYPILQANKIGLFYWVSLPVWLEVVIAIVVLDLLAQYTVHVLLHKVPWLWSFHMVHHSDIHVDATTGTRLHPGDYVFREIYSLLAVVLLGIPIAYYLLYRLLTVLFTYFSHANIQLPETVERVLGTVFVTPDIHKFHHHNKAPWTDSNYGGILIVWDRIFGTYVNDDAGRIRYGVDTMDPERAQEVRYQFLEPFAPGAGKRPG